MTHYSDAIKNTFRNLKENTRPMSPAQWIRPRILAYSQTHNINIRLAPNQFDQVAPLKRILYILIT